MPERLCRDYLMEPGWVEGFTCSLYDQHDGPHRAEGEPIGEDNVGTHADGRKYRWVYEWAYE